jgi:NAD(P)-dependent dehydrogenase (short-subunit alcohol dehydrogenase family)
MADKRRVVVLVSGASSGIGNSCATALAKNGYIVYGTSRAPESRPRKADEFFELIRMDVSDDDSVSNAVSYIRAKEGRIDVLLHSAGAGIAGALEETPILEARKLFDVNVMGAARIIYEVLPDMRKEGGTILVVGSLAGLSGIPFQSYYSASQHALEGLIDSLRLEMAGFPVRVSLIQPGGFRTGFTAARKSFGLGEKSPYDENGRRALVIAEQLEKSGADPILVARLVMRLIVKKRVGPRYSVGFLHQRLAMKIKRLLPLRLAELLLRLYFELHGTI